MKRIAARSSRRRAVMAAASVTRRARPRSPSHPRPRARSLRWRIAGIFTSFSRQRGSELARDGSVDLEQLGVGRLVARVRDGPSRFVVHVSAIRRELQVTCSCPVFGLGRDACRHVWAALVAIDRAGHLRGRMRTFDLVAVRRLAVWNA
jgi:hypothetical protein